MAALITEAPAIWRDIEDAVRLHRSGFGIAEIEALFSLRDKRRSSAYLRLDRRPEFARYLYRVGKITG